ncbi:MAG: hypothetical protein JF612_13100 [Planctomycetia bacterium]|nr:hypothetical protein [Planctomycetia bacterium]
MTQQYVPGQTRQSLQQKHLDWAAHHARNVIPIIPATLTRSESPDSLKIGFVSGDFGLQATSYLALPLMESLDQRRCSTFCYSDRTEPDDAVTTRFRAAATAWRDVGSWRTSSLIDQIRSDQIDVLIDLMGHTGHRLLAFAARPAPLQVTSGARCSTRFAARLRHLRLLQ